MTLAYSETTGLLVVGIEWEPPAAPGSPPDGERPIRRAQAAVRLADFAAFIVPKLSPEDRRLVASYATEPASGVSPAIFESGVGAQKLRTDPRAGANL